MTIPTQSTTGAAAPLTAVPALAAELDRLHDRKERDVSTTENETPTDVLKDEVKRLRGEVDYWMDAAERHQTERYSAVHEREQLRDQLAELRAELELLRTTANAHVVDLGYLHSDLAAAEQERDRLRATHEPATTTTTEEA